MLAEGRVDRIDSVCRLDHQEVPQAQPHGPQVSKAGIVVDNEHFLRPDVLPPFAEYGHLRTVHHT